MSGLAGTMMSGMAFGAGSAVAHQAVNAIAGSFSGDKEKPAQQAVAAPVSSQNASSSACQVDFSRFNFCMKENNNAISACDFYHNALKTCEENNRVYN